ncbi:MAG: HAMP domain-containing protein [Candidatus Omnitrophota bacterium]|nr:HAMP domain-containing protein [Candidatus Omnitrophota bacterium]
MPLNPLSLLFRRKKILANRRVQLKYLVLLIVSMAVPLLFTIGCLYYLIFTIMAEQLGIPESIAYNLFPVVKKINAVLAIGLPPLFLLLIWWGTVLSHRIAGPLQRIEKELSKVTHSHDFSHRIHLRKSDDVRPVADAINKLLDSLHRKGKV